MQEFDWSNAPMSARLLEKLRTNQHIGRLISAAQNVRAISGQTFSSWTAASEHLDRFCKGGVARYEPDGRLVKFRCWDLKDDGLGLQVETIDDGRTLVVGLEDLEFLSPLEALGDQAD